MRTVLFLLLLVSCNCRHQPATVEPPDKEFLYGVNGFHWVPVDKLTMFNAYRIYMPWNWFEQQPGKFRFSPTWQAQGSYDNFLLSLKFNGIEPVLCINQSPAWLLEKGADPDNAPVPFGADMASPESYRFAARMYWQFAARYGEKGHPKELLMVDTLERWTNEGKNPVASGMALVKYIEVWNEPDKWWKRGTNAFFEPEQYAAMLSACYDGHGGKLGDGYGIKGADPSMHVVMAGLTDFDTSYLKRMDVWFRANRPDRKFPADVLNFHHYCNEDGLFNSRENGEGPKANGMEVRLPALMRACASVAPGLPVWWSEFGYDTSEKGASAQYAQVDSAGVWLVESYEMAKAAGLSGAFIYNAIDEYNPDAGLFQSSGIMTGDSAPIRFEPKASYWILKRYLDGQ